MGMARGMAINIYPSGCSHPQRWGKKKIIFTAEKGTGLEISYGKGGPLRSPCEPMCARIEPDTIEMGFRVRSARGRNNEMSAKEESMEIDFNVGCPCLAGSTKPATLR